MATSESIDYNLTASQIMKFALRKINILAAGQDLAQDHSDRAMEQLNLMLKSWMTHRGIWRTKESYLALVADTPSYALTPRPYRVIDCRYRQSGGSDIPMTQLSKQDYYQLPNKTTSGVPTQWYFDPQRDDSTLYVWPVPTTATATTLRVTHQRRFDDVDDASENLDITQEHLETVGYNLAARLADDYGRKGEHINRVIGRASQLYDSMLAADRPEFIEFLPDWRS